MTEAEKDKLLFEYSMKKCAECKALILLKEQIEKMKCYLNCANNSDKCLGKNCYGCKKWELAK